MGFFENLYHSPLNFKRKRYSWKLIEKMEEMINNNPNIPENSPENRMFIEATQKFPMITDVFFDYGANQTFRQNFPMLFFQEIGDYTEFCYRSKFDTTQAAIFIMSMHIFMLDKKHPFDLNYFDIKPDQFVGYRECLAMCAEMASFNSNYKKAFSHARSQFDNVPFTHPSLSKSLDELLFEDGFI